MVLLVALFAHEPQKINSPMITWQEHNSKVIMIHWAYCLCKNHKTVAWLKNPNYSFEYNEKWLGGTIKRTFLLDPTRFAPFMLCASTTTWNWPSLLLLGRPWNPSIDWIWLSHISQNRKPHKVLSAIQWNPFLRLSTTQTNQSSSSISYCRVTRILGLLPFLLLVATIILMTGKSQWRVLLTTYTGSMWICNDQKITVNPILHSSSWQLLRALHGMSSTFVWMRPRWSEPLGDDWSSWVSSPVAC